MLQVYKKLKQFSKKISTLRRNPCKSKLRRFSNLTSNTGRNEVPPKSIHDPYKQIKQILIFLIRPFAVSNARNINGCH